MKKILAIIGAFISIATAGGMIWGGFTIVDERYAHAQVVQELKKDIKILDIKQQYRDANDEYLYQKSLKRKYPDDQEIEEEFEEAKTNRDNLKKVLEELKK